MTEENPFDIDEKASALEEKEEGKKDGEEEEGEGAEEMEEDKGDQQGEESGQEPKTEEEEEEKEEEGGGEKAEGDEESAEKDEEEDKQDREEEAGKDEELPNPAEKGHRPKVRRSKTKCISNAGDVQLCCCVTSGTWIAHRKKRGRRREPMRTKSSPSQLRGRSMIPTVRPESRTSRAIRRWSWRARPQRETKLRR